MEGLIGQQAQQRVAQYTLCTRLERPKQNPRAVPAIATADSTMHKELQYKEVYWSAANNLVTLISGFAYG